MAGGGLNTETFDRLGAYFGIKITAGGLPKGVHGKKNRRR